MFVAMLGIGAGAVYVLGFTILQESVSDDLRGRIFSTLYTLVRLCLLLAFAVGPFLTDLLDRLAKSWFDRRVHLGITVYLPGVRLTLWLAGLIILGAAVLAIGSFRKGSPSGRARDLP
jgi:MFS family permease